MSNPFDAKEVLKVLGGVGSAIGTAASKTERLRRERSVVSGERQVSDGFLREQILLTISHLTGESLEPGFVGRIEAQLSAYFISLDVFRGQTVREWLSKADVIEKFAVAVRAKLTSSEDAFQSAALDDLCRSYSDDTGDKQTAKGVVTLILDLVKSGIEVDAGPMGRAVGAIVEAHVGQLSERLSASQRSAVLDGILNAEIDNQATSALKRIRMRANFVSEGIDDEYLQLFHNLDANGLFAEVSEAVRLELLLRIGLHFAQGKSRKIVASQCVGMLQRSAMVSEAEVITILLSNDKPKTLSDISRLLELDNPTARTLWFSKALSVDRPRALGWFESHEPVSPDFFTPVGWVSNIFNVAIEDPRRAKGLMRYPPDNARQIAPVLNYIEGLLDLLELMPERVWPHVVKHNPLGHANLIRRSGAWAERLEEIQRKWSAYHDAISTVATVSERANQLSLGCWLRFSIPAQQSNAEEELRKAMQSPELAPAFASLASEFSVSVSSVGLTKALARAEASAGSAITILDLKLKLAMIKGDWSQAARLLSAEHNTLIASSMSDEHWAAVTADALIRARLYSEAEDFVRQNSTTLGEDASRLRLQIGSERGDNVADQAIGQYRETGSDIDLLNATNVLFKQRDFLRARPLLEQQLQKGANDPELIERLGRVLHELEDTSAFCALATEHPALFDELRLKRMLLRALVGEGKLDEAERILTEIVDQVGARTCVVERMIVSVATGKWHSWSVAVEDALSLGDSIAIENAIFIASIAAHIDHPQAMPLLTAAVLRAEGNANILAAAATLAIRLGEEKIGFEWMAQAQSNSSEDGPVVAKPATEILPIILDDWQKGRELHSDLVSGSVPRHAIAELRGGSLSRWFLRPALYNCNQQDWLRKELIPIYPPGRPIRNLESIRSVALDLSACFLITYLDLWDQVFASFAKILLPNRFFSIVLREELIARHHQPSRVAAALNLIQRTNDGSIRILDPGDVGVPEWLVLEVGRDDARMLDAARKSNGIVVVQEILKVGTVDQEADLREFTPFVAKLDEFVLKAMQAGLLADNSARRWLATLGHSNDGQADQSNPNANRLLEALQADIGNIWFDQTALDTARALGLLDELRRANLRINVLPTVAEVWHGELSHEDLGKQVLQLLERLRQRMSQEIANQRVGLLPQGSFREDASSRDWFGLPSLVSLKQPADAIWVDDLHLLRSTDAEDSERRRIPIISTLDYLAHLSVSKVEHQARVVDCLANLRRSGFGALSVGHEELLRDRHLVSLTGAEPRIVESPALRTVRQYMQWLRLTNIVELPRDFTFVRSHTKEVQQAIVEYWGDSKIRADVAHAFGWWAHFLLAASFQDWTHRYGSGRPASGVIDTIEALQTTSYAINLPHNAKREAANAWLDALVDHSPLSLRGFSDRMLEQLCKQLNGSEIDPAAKARYVSLIVQSLPPRLKQRLFRRTDLCRLIGIALDITLDIRADLCVPVSRLLKAIDDARTSLSSEFKFDEVSIKVRIDDANIRVGIRENNESRIWQNVEVLELAHPVDAVRMARLALRIEELGLNPSSDHIWLEIASVNPFVLPEIIDFLDREACSIPGVKAAIGQRVETRASARDLVPEDIRYYEQIIGPLAEARKMHAEEYVQKVLLPRASLLGSGVASWKLGTALSAVATTTDRWPDALSQVARERRQELLREAKGWGPVARVNLIALMIDQSEFSDAESASARELLEPVEFLRKSDIFGEIVKFIEIQLARTHQIDSAPLYWRQFAAFAHAEVLMSAVSSIGGVSKKMLKWMSGHLDRSAQIQQCIDLANNVRSRRHIRPECSTSLLPVQLLGALKQRSSASTSPITQLINSVEESVLIELRSEERAIHLVQPFPEQQGELFDWESDVDFQRMIGPVIEELVEGLAPSDFDKKDRAIGMLSVICSLTGFTVEAASQVKSGLEQQLVNWSEGSWKPTRNGLQNLALLIGHGRFDVLLKRYLVLAAAEAVANPERCDDVIGDIAFAASAVGATRDWTAVLDQTFLELVMRGPNLPRRAHMTLANWIYDLKRAVLCDDWRLQRAEAALMTRAVL